MNWFTCIMHVPRHISPVQYFHTRAEHGEQAKANAVKFFLDGDGSQFEEKDVDVPFVFEGRHEPVDDE